MFSFYQAVLTEKSLLIRGQHLVDSLKKCAQKQHTIFVSANFLQSVKISNSASSLLLEQEKNSLINFLFEELQSHTALVLCEKNEILVLQNKQIKKYPLSHVLELNGKKYTFSYDILDYTIASQQQSDFHIHYDTLPFVLNSQQESEKILCEYTKNSTTPCVCLKPVYAHEGYLYTGQSFVTHKGDICARMKTFEADYISFDPENAHSIDSLSNDKYKTLYEALVFGIREHIKESGLTKAAIGISGGIDSALVAPLIAEAIGPENVYAFILPSPNSSDHSVTDAEALAENLNIHTHTFPLKEAMDAFHALLLPAATMHDASDLNKRMMLQNLQSRLRSVLIMGMANALPAFMVGTCNKSEECMGYSTLYGDSCGALFPIGDLYKEEVYELAAWYNSFKGKEIIPQNCFDKAPSAELEPGQKDSDSLPEYPILDTFLFAMLENAENPFTLEHEFPTEKRMEVLKKMKAAEFKRQQGAPIIKLTHITLGKDWI